MELPDRGKVLSALRNCQFRYVLWCQEAVKGKCPYGSGDCATHLQSDIITLLEAGGLDEICLSPTEGDNQGGREK